jgi:hypothetical protein
MRAQIAYDLDVRAGQGLTAGGGLPDRDSPGTDELEFTKLAGAD